MNRGGGRIHVMFPTVLKTYNHMKLDIENMMVVMGVIVIMIMAI